MNPIRLTSNQPASTPGASVADGQDRPPAPVAGRVGAPPQPRQPPHPCPGAPQPAAMTRPPAPPWSGQSHQQSPPRSQTVHHGPRHAPPCPRPRAWVPPPPATPPAGVLAPPSPIGPAGPIGRAPGRPPSRVSAWQVVGLLVGAVLTFVVVLGGIGMIYSQIAALPSSGSPSTPTAPGPTPRAQPRTPSAPRIQVPDYSALSVRLDTAPCYSANCSFDVVLTNYGPQTLSGSIEVKADGQLIATHPFTSTPGSTARFATQMTNRYYRAGGGSGYVHLTAHITPGDQ